ncbi:hypothetical protein Daus18300_012886 [Diaporthe australafricana]|uniref:Uncharacterized protein n=1 Tax=Diaporthe australafricana TaxID=127596 RepID=A0ABR3W0Z9_9PEZI
MAMYPETDYQFGSDLVDCNLPPPTTATAEGRPHERCCKGAVETVLFRIGTLEREVSSLARQERRFDQFERELSRQNRLENLENDLARLERDIAKVLQTVTSLGAELKNFSVEITSRMKHIEVYPPENAGSGAKPFSKDQGSL